MTDNRVQIRVGADLADVREAVGTWLPDQFASSGEAAAAGLAVVYCEHAKKSGMWLISH